MRCGDKEWQHCQEEKRGCPGCYYDEIEVGEYIRTKRGYIRKVIKRDSDKHILVDIGFEGFN